MQPNALHVRSIFFQIFPPYVWEYTYIVTSWPVRVYSMSCWNLSSHFLTGNFACPGISLVLQVHSASCLTYRQGRVSRLNWKEESSSGWFNNLSPILSSNPRTLLPLQKGPHPFSKAPEPPTSSKSRTPDLEMWPTKTPSSKQRR